ncbi:unnamed protein product, partial [Oppiella nova]
QKLDSYETQQHVMNGYINDNSILHEPYGESGHEISILRDKLQESHKSYHLVKSVNESLKRKIQVLDKTRRKSEREVQIIRQSSDELKQRLNEMSVQEMSTQDMVRQYLSHDYSVVDSGCGSGQSYRSLSMPNVQPFNTSCVTINANEMTEDLKDFCISEASKALVVYGHDYKSIADTIVGAFDERYGTCWYCLVGTDSFEHNSLLHVFGTYISFTMNDVKIIVFKTNDMLESNRLLLWSKEGPKVDIVYKNHFTDDNDFEEVVVESVTKAIGEEFVTYRELTRRLTTILSQISGKRYDQNWLVIAGDSTGSFGHGLAEGDDGERPFDTSLHLGYPQRAGSPQNPGSPAPVTELDTTTPFPVDEEDVTQHIPRTLPTTRAPVVEFIDPEPVVRTTIGPRRLNIIQRLLGAVLAPSRVQVGPIRLGINGESLFRMPGVKQLAGPESPLGQLNPYLDEIYGLTTQEPIYIANR